MPHAGARNQEHIDECRSPPKMKPGIWNEVTGAKLWQGQMKAEAISVRRRRPDVEQAWELTSQADASDHLRPEALDSLSQPAPLTEVLDRSVRAAVAEMTLGVSPLAVTAAFADWWGHLALSPGTQAELALDAWQRTFSIAACCSPFPSDEDACRLDDRRFRAPTWNLQPFRAMALSFLSVQEWWRHAITGVRGVSAKRQRLAAFITRQVLDAVSPANSPLTNPEILKRTLETGGANLVLGTDRMLDEWAGFLMGARPRGVDTFAPGIGTALTPGKVIYRNHLIELIQYCPTTEVVRPEPILIVPAWILKYYILDLTPDTSLIRYLVDQGFTVFVISWRNPEPVDRDISFDDYRRLGINAALEVVEEICGHVPVHGVGYCLGGTLLAIAAAAFARDHANSFRTLSLIAAQVDFTEAGELTLFIGESELSFLEDMMWARGVLEARQMAGIFQIMRSHDLIWSRMLRHYLTEDERSLSELDAWSADATRMPYRMHIEYLDRLFLRNELAEGRYLVDDEPVSLTSIRVPVFTLGTERDHIAPWRSVFKFRLFSDAELTFALASGGHNTGVVAPPSSPAHHRILTTPEHAPYIDPDRWLRSAELRSGSWWPSWRDWLIERSGNPVPARRLGGPGYPPREEAPGTYVLQA